MNKYFLLMICFALCVACSSNIFGQKCTSDDYSLIATFASTVEGHPVMISSDGGGAYNTVKGKGVNTEVMFQVCNGSNDFTMNLNMSARTMKVQLPTGIFDSAFFNFDRIASVPVTVDSGNRFADFCGGRNADLTIKLDQANTTPPADNYAGCGWDAKGYFVRRNVGFQLPSSRSLRFQNSPYDGGTVATGTNYIKVYHPDPVTWTLEPEEVATGKCGVLGSCAVLIYHPTKGPAETRGYSTERFSLTVSSSKLYP